jgi:hypothetical protein
MKDDQTHNGMTWADMPGADAMMKRMNFSLFKRGKVSLMELKQGAMAKERKRAAAAFMRKRRAIEAQEALEAELETPVK